MNESTKTLAFVLAAAALGSVAYVTRPKLDFTRPDETGQLFYPGFKDPSAATSLELIRFNESTGEAEPFKVAKLEGRWVLPSHENYPADAQQKIGQAAASLVDLRKLGLATKSPADHEKLGVVDPATARPGSKGTGLKATLADSGGKNLASFIIGKEVQDDPKQRFVRVPGQDAVYRVTVNPSQLSSKFEDWIEKDLLKLNTWDIKRVLLNNYSVDLLNKTIVQGENVDASYDDSQSKWSLADLKEGEELNTETLNAMKTALDDLKIIDVRRKPAGLSAGLRQEEDSKIDLAAIESLQNKGFYMGPDGSLVSNKGETVVQMKDGVTYVLRFGEIAGPAAAAADAHEGADGKTAAPTGQNRYLFVMAQFDPNLIEKPQLEPLPEAPASSESNKESAAPASAPPAGETPQADSAAPSESAPPEAGADGDGAAVPQSSPESSAAPQAQPEEKPADPTAPPADAAADELKKERERVEQENKRKQDEYQKKLDDGAKRVKELNDRFADWYYIISDDVYRKIHLARRDVVKSSGVPPVSEGGAVKQFQDLQSTGIEGQPAPSGQ